MPVPVEQLGAYLQAYKDTLPVRASLIHCVRAGKGSITKLPLEIIDEIIEHLTQEEREENEQIWTPQYLISTRPGMTTSLDYIKDGFLWENKNDGHDMLRRTLLDFSSDCCSTCAKRYANVGDPKESCSSCLRCHDFDDRTAWQSHPDAKELVKMVQGWHMWDDAVLLDIANWHDDVVHDELLSDMEELLDKHFGLRIWITSEDKGEDEDNIVDCDTTALLLPRSATIQYNNNAAVHEDMDNDALQSTTSPCISHEGLPVLSVREREAFRRVLRKLQLTPCTHLDREACPYPDEEAPGTDNLSRWPQLVSLSRVKHRRREGSVEDDRTVEG